ncbi:DNA adenine methylase [Lachnospiraceae bacterium 54-53]
MNSFIGWIGGKRLLRKVILERFPENGIRRYIEVFGGAGWLLFSKDKHAPLEVFNDLDGDLVNLYRCIKYHRTALQEELEWLLTSREQFYAYREQLKVSHGMTDIQRAARFFYLVKISFGNDRRTFATSSKNIEHALEYMKKVQDRLRGVVIEQKDYAGLIHVYDRKDALFYLDPPYVGTESYYQVPFTTEDHQKLAGILKGIQGRFILSYNDDPLIRCLYKDFMIEEIARKQTLSGNGKNKDDYAEVIIRNF